MELLERFAELLFRGMPPGEDAEQARAEVLETLKTDYELNLKDGMTPDGALAQTLVCFGALDAAENAYRRCQMIHRRGRFEKLYRLLHRGGLTALLVLPLLLLVLLTRFHVRGAVEVWILSILLLAGCLALLEWRRAYYRKQTEPPPEEASTEEDGRSDMEDGK